MQTFDLAGVSARLKTGVVLCSGVRASATWLAERAGGAGAGRGSGAGYLKIDVRLATTSTITG